MATDLKRWHSRLCLKSLMDIFIRFANFINKVLKKLLLNFNLNLVGSKLYLFCHIQFSENLRIMINYYLFLILHFWRNS
jgi:hypothetical protein